MFKKFTSDEISSQSNVKSSIQRSLRSKFLEEFPAFEPHADDLLPKKEQLVQYKCADKIVLFSLGPRLIWVQRSQDELLPTLRLIHLVPRDVFPWVSVDRGAIKFILGGAHIMCPGLTSAGASMPHDYEKGQLVVVYAEGKEHALALGKLELSTEDIRKNNKGIGITVIMYLGDGLWNLGPLP